MADTSDATRKDAEKEQGASAAPAESSQPGLRELREAVANARRHLPGGSSLRRDGVAGLSLAVANVPDGMANGALVGVNPLFGLYATMLGPIVGGLLSSTRLMVITTTAAASLTAAQSVSHPSIADRPRALFALVILAGVFQILIGALGLARLTRFVSYSVTTGFLAGISALLILSQIPTIGGYAATGNNRVTQAIDVVVHWDDINPAAVGTGLLALVLAIFLPRTPLRNFGRLVAVIVPSLIVALAGLDVKIVADVGQIEGSIPRPQFPFRSFLDVLTILTGALSVAIVTLVQGVGVSQSVPNRDGSRTRLSRDFIAHGAANIACGLFRGLPVGGSLSGTAVNVISGASTRLSSVFAGLWMAVIVIGVPSLVSFIAMPALGALLVVAGASSLKPSEVSVLRNAGWPSLTAGVTTFLATLLLPIQAAVALGVVLSAFLFLGHTASAVLIVEIVKREDGRIEERDAPSRLPDRSVTVLDVYGNLFYAGARTFEHALPAVRGADRPAVVIRLRGREQLGATLLEVLGSYAAQLAEVNGRLYLTGVSRNAHQQLLSSEKLRHEHVQSHRATPIVLESTTVAVADARAWLESDVAGPLARQVVDRMTGATSRE